MERSTNPTPINPNAKYLPNSISNVLNSIQKFDQGTLAWPTGSRKRHTWKKRLSRVPLAGTASKLISNSRGSKSKHCEKVNKKNTFYQILQASQDQPSSEKSAKRKRIKLKTQGDDIYNNIYDIVRKYLQLKRQEDNKGQKADSPKVSHPMNEIYRVRPRVTETTQQKYSRGEGGKSTSRKAKIPIVEFYRPPGKPNEQRARIVTETHKSVSKSKNQQSGVNKHRKLSINIEDIGQNIIKENSNDRVEAGLSSSPAQSHRKQANKVQKRNTKSRLQKSNVNKNVKLQKKSPKNVSHLNNSTKAVQEGVLGNSKDTSKESEKLENKSPDKKDKSKESPKVGDRQDNPKVSVKLQEKSLKNYYTDISKFFPKAKHYQDNMKEKTKLKQIIPADQGPARIVYKSPKTIYTKVSKSKMFKNIANKSHNLTDQKLYETRMRRPYSNENTEAEKVPINSEKKNSYKFANSLLYDIYKIRGSKLKKSITEGTEGKNSIIKGRTNNKTKKRTPIEEYELRRAMKTKPKSIREIQRNRILKAKNTENESKTLQKEQNGLIIPDEPYEPLPVIPSQISSVTNEPVQPSRRSQVRRRQSRSTKNSYRFASSLLYDIYKIRGSKLKKSITEGRPDSITEGKNSIMEGRSNNKTKKRTTIEEYELRRSMKTKPESIREIQRNQILKAKNTENESKTLRKVQNNFIIPKEPYEPPPVIPSQISSVTNEPVQPTRLSQIMRRPLEMPRSRTRRKSYMEKLWKFKEFLNNMDDDTGSDLMDFQGIELSDLLFYPYDDIYQRNGTIENKDNTAVNKKKSQPKPPEKELKPTEMKKQCKKPLEKKSACMMCKAIRRPEKDAPFLVQMRMEQKRQELMAYRAHKEMCYYPSQRSRAQQLPISYLDKKLYSLGDKDIVFSRPKKSNSSIFPSSSKTKAYLKRCHSFTFPKESRRIICS